MRARALFSAACEAQPLAAQAWLDWAKMEEERGLLKRSAKILHCGLLSCDYSEPLLAKAIKHEERQHALGAPRPAVSGASSTGAVQAEAARGRPQRSAHSAPTARPAAGPASGPAVMTPKRPKVLGAASAQSPEPQKGKEVKGQAAAAAAGGLAGLEAAAAVVARRYDCSLALARAAAAWVTHRGGSGIAVAGAEAGAQAAAMWTVGDDFEKAEESEEPQEGEEHGEKAHEEEEDEEDEVQKKEEAKVHEAAALAVAGAGPADGSKGQDGLAAARALLARLKGTPIDRVWRSVLEGALLEARSGEVVRARRVLKFLMHSVPWYGPIYGEAVRLEERCDRPHAALALVEQGLSAIPRYGPLWFGLLRIAERLDLDDWLRSVQAFVKDVEAQAQQAAHHAGAPDDTSVGEPVESSVSGGDGGRDSGSSKSSSISSISTGSNGSSGANFSERAAPLVWPPLEPPLERTRRALADASHAISKELVWKVLFEGAAAEERAAQLARLELANRRAKLGGIDAILAELRRARRARRSAVGAPPAAPLSSASSLTSSVSSTASLPYPAPALASAPAPWRPAAAGFGVAAQGCGEGGPSGDGSGDGSDDGLHAARATLASAALACPHNLRWKVWLAAARLELAGPDNLLVPSGEGGAGEGDTARAKARAAALAKARTLLSRAHAEVPEKSRAVVLLDCARLEEYASPGDPSAARYLLRRACAEVSSLCFLNRRHSLFSRQR